MKYLYVHPLGSEVLHNAVTMKGIQDQFLQQEDDSTLLILVSEKLVLHL
jgi:hypothetical protein